MTQGENGMGTHDPPPNKSERSVQPELASQLVESLRGGEEQEGDADSPAAAHAIIRDAVRERATDVHLDPDGRGLNVRLRIDGVMRDAAILPPRQGHRLVNQLKSLGGIDPVAQFHADEARFAFQHEEGEVDVRLAVIPCLHGQKLTLRVLNPRQLAYGIDELGLCDYCRRSGCFGQTGVFEVWQLDEDDYHRLLDGATEREVRHSLKLRSHKRFLADALEKAEAGVTTLAEVHRLRLVGPAFPTGAE